ncbi:MAG TPA: hypothetical protein VJ843_01485 [Candidatus Saccharimonadales bacterium]|nr:hypothetical protein [Candidatus Saccharimonadales bacterium]
MSYQVPKEIWANLQSAQSLLDDADALPGALKHNATRYFFYIKAWELYRIADAKFSAWAQEKPLSPKVLKDHGYKLDGSPNVEYIVIIEHKPVITNHETGSEKSKLLQKLTYGEGTISRNALFARGWFFDDFHNDLIGKLKLLRVALESLEKM